VRLFLFDVVQWNWRYGKERHGWCESVYFLTTCYFYIVLESSGALQVQVSFILSLLPSLHFGCALVGSLLFIEN